MCLAFLAAGCERAPLDCASVDSGALVITELSGNQGDSNPLGEWIELFNAGNATIPLLGLRIELTTLDGSRTQEFAVRENIQVAPGAYVTFGRFAAGDPGSDHVDYGYKTELDDSLFTTAAIEVVVCGEQIDRVIYRDLPSDGTLAFNGTLAPSATANDDDENFCVDNTGGSPRQENPPCI